MINTIKLLLLSITLTLLIAANQAQASTLNNICADPETAVINTLNCIESEDAWCAAAGYAPDFVKLHNGVDTNTVISGVFYWWGAFLFYVFKNDIDHVALVDDNQISIRYVETVTFFDGATFLQHEHALVTVDSNCQMTLWDQYGDNAEQAAVDDKADTINPF